MPVRQSGGPGAIPGRAIDPSFVVRPWSFSTHWKAFAQGIALLAPLESFFIDTPDCTRKELNNMDVQEQHTADIIVLWHDQLLLIQRRKAPYAGMWALPGGKRNEHEPIELTAIRELREETGLQMTQDELVPVGVFDSPGRDPRPGVWISHVFLVCLDEQPPVRAGDDAQAAQWAFLSDLPPLAFDHEQMLGRALPLAGNVLSARTHRRATMTLKQLLVKKASTPQPRTVVLCGSTRFVHAFHEANLRETLAGHMVYSIGCDTKSDADLQLAGQLTAEDKERLDVLHLFKIDQADEILVLNVGGYVGTSTRREIEYARSCGKSIRWLEEPAELSARKDIPA